jgi:diaminopimelate epimerase
VLIDMGKAESRGVHRAEFDGAERTFDLVSIGNPHAVALDFLPSLEKIDRFAPMVSATLPGGVNIEFVHEQSEGVFRVVVWERGVGRTQACGTGAAAVASVLARLGRIGYGAPAQVELPGGRLELSVAPGSLDVRLRGPARRVFGGALPAPPVGAREST